MKCFIAGYSSIVVNSYELLGVRLSIFSVISKYVIRQNILGFSEPFLAYGKKTAPRYTGHYGAEYTFFRRIRVYFDVLHTYVIR